MDSPYSSDDELVVIPSSTAGVASVDNSKADKGGGTEAVPSQSRESFIEAAPPQVLQDDHQSQEDQIRTLERHLAAEKQLTATLDTALVDLEDQAKSNKLQAHMWKDKALASEAMAAKVSELLAEEKAKSAGQDETKDIHESANDSGSVNADEIEPGMLCEVYTISNHSSAMDLDTSKYALVAYRDSNVRSEGARQPLQGVDVQSPILQDMLETIFSDHPSWTTMNSKKSRYLCGRPKYLFHRWTEVVDALHMADDCVVEDHISLFVDFYKEEFADVFKAYEAYRLEEAIPFNYLWTVFPFGSLVYCKPRMMEETILRVKQIRYNQPGEDVYPELSWIVEGTLVAFDGQSFGNYDTLRTFPECKVVDFTKSAVIPLDLHPDKEAVKSRITARGQRLVEISKQRVWSYSGRPQSFYMPDMHREKIHERILLHPGAAPVKSEALRWTEKFRGISPLDGEENLGEVSLTEEELLMTVPDIPVYRLTSQCQDVVFVKDVKDVEWDTKAFGKFALCSDMKKLLADLISGHTSSECTYEDMVAGKGTGLSVALSGASGSGKTSLVYALAEKHHKAVLEFTLAKLDEYKFEDKLRDLFELGAATQSIVLLNEVCQWLETAAAEEWKQYMLLTLERLLDENRGIVFLTVRDPLAGLSASIASRVDLSISMSGLGTVRSRSKVWKAHLSHIPDKKKNLTDAQIDKLATDHSKLKGSEIPKIVKIAHMRSKSRGGVLSLEHIEKVMKTIGKASVTPKSNVEPAPEIAPALEDPVNQNKTDTGAKKTQDPKDLSIVRPTDDSTNWGTCDWGFGGWGVRKASEQGKIETSSVIPVESQDEKAIASNDWGTWATFQKSQTEKDEIVPAVAAPSNAEESNIWAFSDKKKSKKNKAKVAIAADESVNKPASSETKVAPVEEIALFEQEQASIPEPEPVPAPVGDDVTIDSTPDPVPVDTPAEPVPDLTLEDNLGWGNFGTKSKKGKTKRATVAKGKHEVLVPDEADLPAVPSQADVTDLWANWGVTKKGKKGNVKRTKVVEELPEEATPVETDHSAPAQDDLLSILAKPIFRNSNKGEINPAFAIEDKVEESVVAEIDPLAGPAQPDIVDAWSSWDGFKKGKKVKAKKTIPATDSFLDEVPPPIDDADKAQEEREEDGVDANDCGCKRHLSTKKSKKSKAKKAVGLSWDPEVSAL